MFGYGTRMSRSVSRTTRTTGNVGLDFRIGLNTIKKKDLICMFLIKFNDTVVVELI